MALCGSIDCQLLENLLHSSERELEPLVQRALLVETPKKTCTPPSEDSEFTVAIRDDPYFNSLQVKYGYAMTCHKAQGGEWTTAVVDFQGYPRTAERDIFPLGIQAITHAKTSLFISAPVFTAESAIAWGTLPPTPKKR